MEQMIHMCKQWMSGIAIHMQANHTVIQYGKLRSMSVKQQQNNKVKYKILLVIYECDLHIISIYNATENGGQK